MQSRTTRLIAVLIFATLLLSVSGCSRVTIAYNTADFFIEGYAKDYLELDDSQVASWRPMLQSALASHRRDDLPYLARFFETARKGAENGFDRPRMRCLINQLDELYRRNLKAAAGLAAPLLAELTPNQIRALERKFRKEKMDDKPNMGPAAAARRDRKRAERYQESASWWIGSLTSGQKEIIREQTAAMPDTAAAWLTYRSTRRSALIKLLNQRAGKAEIQDFLESWLAEHRDIPVSLSKARRRIYDRITELFIRMDKSFSAKQRAHFADRLSRMRDDLMSLQARPRMAPENCR